MQDKLADLRERKDQAYSAGSARAVERQNAKGKLLARERIEYLLDPGRIPVEEHRAAFPRGRAALVALARRGLAAMDEVAASAGGEALLPAAEAPLSLTPAQAEALARIAGAFGSFRTFLLHGVTGSGKTEVYLQAIARARAAGRGALVLVPEIALTPQLAGRFRARFGDEVALLHSGLSDRERHSEWLRLRRRSVTSSTSATAPPATAWPANRCPSTASPGTQKNRAPAVTRRLS